MHLDLELRWFIYAVIAMLAIGIPRIMKRISLPAQLQFQEVSPGQLTAKQTDFFQLFDTKLNELAYHPMSTFRVPNLQGANLSRVYTNSSDPARILVSALSAPRGNVSHSYVEIITRYQDGTILSTKNSNVSTVFAAMPKKVSQSFRGIQDVGELKKRHDSKAQTLLSNQPLYRDPNAFFGDFASYHQQFLSYQQSKGLLRLDPQARVYRATFWTGLRGVRNYLNPLADNFTLPRFILGLMGGMLLPILVVTQRAFLVGWIQSRYEIDPATCYLGLLAFAYTLGGVVLGGLFKQKSYIWAFVFGYFPARLLGPATALELGFSIWMAILAHQVSHWRMRSQKLV